MTIRIREDDLTAAVLTALHEGGHGLYDQGFAERDRNSLLGDAPSMGLHESQSRLWENHIGRSAAFWEFLSPAIRKLFPEVMNGLDAGALHRMVNLVQPDTNRVDADEMSYHLHIVFRYELEQALLSGALSVAELPAAWNERSTALLSVTPASDREGVLQDVHWSLGMFGYFPTYTLGSLYAAQFAETYARENPLEDEIKRGDFRPLLGWLRENVHRYGHRLTAEGLVNRATGRGLDAASFFRYLESKRITR
jgi:carboxypeptidase Taq